MIALYGFGRAFGLADPSPFVTKVEVVLTMAGRAHRRKRGNFPKAPEGKTPYIDDDGVIIADSTFIRWHLERNTARISPVVILRMPETGAILEDD